MFRASVRTLATLVAAIGVAACADSPTAAPKPSVGGRGSARVGFEPVFSAAARIAAARLADFGINFDHVRVVIVRPAADTVKDTTVAFAPGQADLTLDLDVTVKTDNETFNASIDYTSQNGVVFHGEGSVQSHAPDQPAPTQAITVQYVGPGSTVARIVVSPKTSSIVPPATIPFTVTAFDASNAPVVGTPYSWTVSDPSVATISNTGTLTTTGRRGTITVTALTPTNISDNASVTVDLPPTGIALVSGGGQSGRAGTTLAQPAVVRVTAVDGIGVPGVSVNFAAPVGGKVGAARVTTDAGGNASTTLTLGGTLGSQSFAAVALGFSVAIPATAVGGDPASITVVSGNGQSDTVQHALKLPLIVKVADSFGNPVGNTTVSWTRTAGSGTLSSPTSTTGPDGLASVSYSLGATSGVETITASVAGVTTPATFTEAAFSGSVASIAIVSGNGQTARIFQTLAPFVVKATDVAGNPVSGAVVMWVSSNGTLAASTTTDSSGQSSNTMTLGAAAGTASATASVAGKSVAFSVVVQVGVVAKTAFTVGPPPTVVAATAIVPSIQVSLQDAGGNLAPGISAVTISLGANPGDGTLTGTLTRNAVAGVATFDDLQISRSGVGYTLVASSSGTPITTSAPFTVAAGAPTTMTILAGDGIAGTAGSVASPAPSVQVTDKVGNAVQGVPVTFAAGPSSGAVSPVTPVLTDAAGVATLTTWTFGTAPGAQTVTATSPGVPTMTFHAGVTAGPPARLAVTTQPSATAQSGIAFPTQPVVQLQDAYGNASPQSGVTVTAAIASGGGTLGGTASVNTDALGRATFTNLQISGTVGPHTLSFSSLGLTATTSASIALGPGTPSRLAWSVAPTGAAAGIAISPALVVNVLDADGNVVTGASNTVTLAITAGTGTLGASLGGTTSLAASSGVATYSGVTVSTAGAGYSLTATSLGLTSAVTGSFTVTPGLLAADPPFLDAVFSTVPITLNARIFIPASTTLSVVGSGVSASPLSFIDTATATTDFSVSGGVSTTTLSLTITTPPFGTSNVLPYTVYSVGTAPVQLGISYGDSGGSPYSLDCAAGELATGLNVRGGSNVDQLQVICQPITGPSRTFGAQSFTAAVGGTGGSPATLSCPANYVLVGLTGRIGSGGGGLNDMIAGVCQPVTGGSTVTTASVGSNFSGSIAYTSTCPVGLALAGIQGGAGTLLDRTQIKCR